MMPMFPSSSSPIRFEDNNDPNYNPSNSEYHHPSEFSKNMSYVTESSDTLTSKCEFRDEVNQDECNKIYSPQNSKSYKDSSGDEFMNQHSSATIR